MARPRVWRRPARGALVSLPVPYLALDPAACRATVAHELALGSAHVAVIVGALVAVHGDLARASLEPRQGWGALARRLLCELGATRDARGRWSA